MQNAKKIREPFRRPFRRPFCGFTAFVESGVLNTMQWFQNQEFGISVFEKSVTLIFEIASCKKKNTVLFFW